MLGVYLENVRSKKPLIHNITNYVTVNDVANILLACGASPIMSDDAGEVEEITSACGGALHQYRYAESKYDIFYASGGQAGVVAWP